jgi:hypothetical protein
VADVVDAFVVTLGLKDDDFVRHARIVLELQKKMREEAHQQTKETQENAAKSVASFASIKREVLGLTSLILGGMGITEFVQKTIALTANVGRLSTILGQSTEQISAWQGAIRAMGGTSEEASGDLMKIVQAFEDIQLTGNSPMIPVLRQLGFGLDDLKDPTAFLLKLSDRLSAMPDKREAFNLGSRLGLSPEMVNLLIQGRKVTQEYLDAAAKAYPIHQRDAAAAIEAQKQFSLLRDSWQRLGNTVLVELAPSLIKLADGLEGIALFLNQNPALAMTGFGVAMFFAASGAFRLAAGLAAAGAANIATIARILALLAGVPGAAVAGGAALSLIPGRARGSLAGAGAGRSIDEQIAALQKQLADPDAPKAYVQRRLAELLAKRAVLGGKADFATPIGAGAVPAQLAAGGSVPGQVAAFFQAHGASAAGAAGIGAGVAAEGGSEFARDQYDSRGRYAYGVFQLRGALQKKLFAQYGPNANLAQQLQFVLGQLKTDPSLGGASIFGATNPVAALQTFIAQFLRPGRGAAGDLERGARALHIGTLIIHAGAGADGRQIARDLQAELIAQGNRGMS